MAVYGNTSKTQGQQSLKAKAQAAQSNYEFAKELGATSYANPNGASATQSARRSKQQTTTNQRGQ